MSQMIEIYYRMPVDPVRESAWEVLASSYGGKLDFREVPEGTKLGGICLTFEFKDMRQAEDMVELLRRQGEHVEGPASYGPTTSATSTEFEPGLATFNSKTPIPQVAPPRRSGGGGSR